MSDESRLLAPAAPPVGAEDPSTSSTSSVSPALLLAPGKKRVVLCTVGSRGDTQPYIVLGLALRARGHHATIATERRLQPLVTEFGLPFAAIEGDSTGVLYAPEAQAALLSGSFLRLMSLTKAWEAKFDKAAILRSYEGAVRGADVVVGAALCLTQSLSAAEGETARRRRSDPSAPAVAWAAMILGPTWPTSEYPLWALAGVTCGMRCLNRWTYDVAFKALWGQEAKAINEWRTRGMGIEPMPAKGKGTIEAIVAQSVPTIVAGSSLLCGPHSRVPGDYPDFVKVGGFLFAPDAEAADIPERVRAFVLSEPSSSPPGGAGGGRPLPLIYLGFGSMPAPDPFALVRLSVDVCRQAGCRALLVAGWTALDADPSCAALVAEAEADGTLLVAKSVPHGWLFPRVKCIVHHCGVGTMAAALRAGIPQVPCPFMLDQPHNAKLLVSLGVAPASVPYNARLFKGAGKALVGAVRAVLDDARLNEGRASGEGGPLAEAARKYGAFVRKESARSADLYCEVVEGARPVRGAAAGVSP